MSADVPQLYRALIRARLQSQRCAACGESLEHAAVVSAGEGTTLEEYGLSETSAARVLAATELLSVRCDRCGASNEVGFSLVQRSEARLLSADDLAQWSAKAVDVYRSIVRARLADRSCTACGHSLESAAVTTAGGGTVLPEFDLDDEAAVSIIAWTQCLNVPCPHCGTLVKIG